MQLFASQSSTLSSFESDQQHPNNEGKKIVQFRKRTKFAKQGNYGNQNFSEEKLSKERRKINRKEIPSAMFFSFKVPQV